jgi:hypothetical protein
MARTVRTPAPWNTQNTTEAGGRVRHQKTLNRKVRAQAKKALRTGAPMPVVRRQVDWLVS